jgi:hypothetical protein
MNVDSSFEDPAALIECQRFRFIERIQPPVGDDNVCAIRSECQRNRSAYACRCTSDQCSSTFETKHDFSLPLTIIAERIDAAMALSSP